MRARSVDVAKTEVRRMNLRTAPCTQCQIPVVYGQRSCLNCGQRFNYGDNPPPEPSQEIIQKAFQQAKQAKQAPRREHPTAELDAEQQRLLAERLAKRKAQQEALAQLDLQAQLNAQAAAPPAAAVPSIDQQLQAQLDAQAAVQAQLQSQMGAAASPVGEGGQADFVDTGRYTMVREPVQTEAIPGFIDSTLFAAYTPKEDSSTRMEGLEGTAHEGGDAPVLTGDPRQLGVELTAQQEVGEVAVEDIPGFIDSTLFAAYTPATVETQEVAGLETSPSRPRVFTKAAGDDEETPCASCGTKYPLERSRCPSCGSPRSTEV